MAIAYHYTSLATLLSILKDREWHFTNIGFLNDGNEFHYAMELAMHKLPEWSDLSLRNQVLPYWLSCFSIHRDSFSQWGLYGDGGKGVAIAVEADDLPNAIWRLGVHGGYLYPLNVVDVVYDSQAQERALSDIVARWNDDHSTELLGELSHLSCTFKQSQFQSEGERRLVQFFPFVDGDSSKESELTNYWELCRKVVGYRIRGHRLIPYIHLPITHATVIKEIILGPYIATDMNEAIVRHALHRHDLSHVAISRSQIRQFF